MLEYNESWHTYRSVYGGVLQRHTLVCTHWLFSASVGVYRFAVWVGYTHTHTYTNTHTHTHTHTHTRTYTETHLLRVWTLPTNTHAYTFQVTHIFIHVCLYADLYLKKCRKLHKLNIFSNFLWYNIVDM